MLIREFFKLSIVYTKGGIFGIHIVPCSFYSCTLKEVLLYMRMHTVYVSYALLIKFCCCALYIVSFLLNTCCGCCTVSS